MKTPQKPKRLLAKKTKRRHKTLLANAKLVYAKTPVVRHLRLIELKHTGKLISHRHTSHVALMLILMTVGLFMYASQAITRAVSVTSGGAVTIGVIVKGPPPAVGAQITAPANGTVFTNLDPIQVGGGCAPNTFVVVYDNSNLAGSTSCSSTGTFILTIQLQEAGNSLTALNFDNLNQAGPTTSPITVNVTLSNSSVVVTKVVKSDSTKPPQLPANPSIISGVTTGPSTCNDYSAPTNLSIGGKPQIQLVCVPRLIDPLTPQSIGLLAWGGQPPYAISLSWGYANKNTIISMPSPGYKTVSVKYDVAGFFVAAADMVDSRNQSSVANASIQVNGTPVAQVAPKSASAMTSGLVDSTVPLYIIAVALTFGFWGGDIFDRKYGARYKNSRHQRIVR